MTCVPNADGMCSNYHLTYNMPFFRSFPGSTLSNDNGPASNLETPEALVGGLSPDQSSSSASALPVAKKSHPNSPSSSNQPPTI